MSEPASSNEQLPDARRTSPGRLVLRFLMSVALAYLLVALTAFLFQRRLIYFPLPGPVELPVNPGYAGLSEVDLKTSDGVGLKAWYWPGERQLVLLVLHGNAGHRGHRLEWIDCLHRTGAGVFLLDYRGYGGSEGSPCEDGLYRDAEAAASWLASSGRGPLVYVGESLGAAVAVELALRRPPEALILQSPFTSLAGVGSLHYSYFPVGLLLRERFEVLPKIERIRCPVLVIHGGKDSIVPVSMGRKVFESAAGPKDWMEIAGGDHNDALWEDSSYSARLKVFLKLSP
jgi:fermentation-respiration switch protein FrsA (DUF1100 family)